MMKRIILCFDGTWNTPNDHSDVESGANTNVRKLYNSIPGQDQHGIKQHAHYIPGVGDRWYNRVRGGVFGVGLDERIKQGYRHLVDQYDDGDEIYVIGFSRGAYTARSLVGMIRNVGLLTRASRREVNAAYELYRTRDEGPDSPVAQTFRDRYSRPATIKCLGVWDTVGALGVPLRSFGWFNSRRYEFHDTELSGIVKNALHAVAIDEHRSSFQPTLWDPKEKPNQSVKQVWFSGAHADVGGGYHRANLSDITLRWMADWLAENGLETAVDIEAIGETNLTAEPHDSFKDFLKGAYQRVSSRHFRSLGNTAFGNENLASPVLERFRLLASYRPRNRLGPHLILRDAPISGVHRLRDIVEALPPISRDEEASQ